MKTNKTPRRANSRLVGTTIPRKSISTIVAALAVLVLPAAAIAQSQSIAIPIGSGTEPPLFSGLGPFNPSDARVTAPFMVSGTNVFQTVETNDPSSGGDLEFRFNAPFTADYQVSALLSCPDGGSNSLYINIDGQPSDPTMIWDVPITNIGNQQRTASWRGSATGGSPPQFYPKIWHLTQGEHLFVIRGREANAVIGPITIGTSAAWKMTPASGDWNNAANWTSSTIPNGSADGATFGVSNTTAVSISGAQVTLYEITFFPGASPFTITAAPTMTLDTIDLSGVGITNNSGIMQNFVAEADAAGNRGRIKFSNTASAGNLTNFTIQDGGVIEFYDASTAGNGAFTLNPGGSLMFAGASAGNATFTINGPDYFPAEDVFFFSASAGNGIFTINSGGVFFDHGTAANSVLIANGNAVANSNGSQIIFFGTAFADSATLIANGGTNGGTGGSIYFLDGSSGGTARVQVYGNAGLHIGTERGRQIGSLEGNGNVFLGSGPFVGEALSVGTNNLSTTFSGAIHDSGAFAKIGTGTLVLSGLSSFTGGTNIYAGKLEGAHDGALGGGDVSLKASGTILSLQNGATNNYIFDTATLNIITGSSVNLNYNGNPDVIGFLIVNGVSQPPGVYGGPASGAPHQLSQFTGPGTILVTTPVAASRRLHGSSNFDTNLPFSGNAGIECRNAGSNNAYQVVVTFGLPITFSSASITSGTGTVSGIMGNGTAAVTINLNGVSDAQTLTVTLFGVNYGVATGNVDIRMSILIGDTNGSGAVNSTDISQTKMGVGSALTNANFREDVTVNGAISSSDVSLVKSHSGSVGPFFEQRTEEQQSAHQ